MVESLINAAQLTDELNGFKLSQFRFLKQKNVSLKKDAVYQKRGPFSLISGGVNNPGSVVDNPYPPVGLLCLISQSFF